MAKPYEAWRGAIMEDEYLGDGVYASFDGYQVWLDTRAQEPVNRIALEARTFHALLTYVKNLRRNNNERQTDG